MRQAIEDLLHPTFDEEVNAAGNLATVPPRAEEDAVVATLLIEELPAAPFTLEEDCEGLARELLSELEQVQGVAEAIHAGENIKREHGAVSPGRKSGRKRRIKLLSTGRKLPSLGLLPITWPFGNEEATNVTR